MDDLITFLYDAAASPFGLSLTTDDPERLRQRLYGLKKQDPSLSDLSLVIPSEPDRLWIVKRNPDVD